MLSNPLLTSRAAQTPPAGATGDTTGSSSASSSKGAFGGGVDGMFMQLLVTQLKNQDPLAPMDPATFVNQLVGVTNLDQVSQINQLLQSAFKKLQLR